MLSWCDEPAKRCRAQLHAMRHKTAEIPKARMTCALCPIIVSNPIAVRKISPSEKIS